MAILTISNGKYGNEYIVIKKGEVWQIDKYTMEFEDSAAIRMENQSLFQNFQSRYPHANRGSIRLFLTRDTEERTEWLVFYKKHKTVFPKILDDSNFMDYYFDGGSKYLTSRDISSVDDFPDRLGYYMISICDALKRKDQESGYAEGGPLYYGFMRDILYRYIDYSSKHKKVKTIDQLYSEYYKNISEEPNFFSDEHSSFPTPSVAYEDALREIRGDDIDPDIAIYDAMDNLVSICTPLQEFLSNPHFERHYGNLLEDSYLFILGNSIKNHEQQEIYEKWYQYGKDGFDGTIVCPQLSINAGCINEFEKSNITFFCIFEEDTEIEKMISLALLNKSEVILYLYDASLYPRYTKKYPQTMIVLPRTVDSDKLTEQVDSFMISCYNRMKEKRYQQ